MALTKEKKQQIIEEYRRDEKDTDSRRGLLKKIGQRRSMLQYLAKTDITRYRELIQKLGLRK